MLLLISYSTPDRGADKYCDECVCLSVCTYVCVSTIISSELHARSSPYFSASYLWPLLSFPLAA